jgi:hypothetical protein
MATLAPRISAPLPVRAPVRSRARRASHVRAGTSERRAGAGDSDSSRPEKLMGRKGTNREATEDDVETAAVKKAVKLDGAFGKPSASKETWQPFQRAARAGLLEACLTPSDADDLVLTSLYLAMEDDAFKSRTAVCLPIDAYVKRVDKLVTEFMQRDYAAMESAGEEITTVRVIDALEDFLYAQNKYRAPAGWREMYSPYRTYFHNVVAQKVGIPATLAALYIGCVDRLRANGALKEDVDVLLRPKASNAAGAAGVTAPKAPWGVPAGSPRPANAVVCTPVMSVRLQLAALKRAFWPWEWDDSRDSGALLAVEAAAYGTDNRMNTAAGVVGIIQPTGRPFGDLAMAILATERLLELDGGVGFEARDLGVLLFHDGKPDAALEKLEAFFEWKESGGADAPPAFVGDVLNLGGSNAALAAELQVREDAALDALVLQLRKMALEKTISDGVKSGEV